MAPNYAYQFPIENFSLNNIQLAILILGLVEFILLNLVIDTKKIYSFLGFQSSARSQLMTADDSKINSTDFTPSTGEENGADKILSRGDIDVVLSSLELSFDSDEGRFPAVLGANDLSTLFEEKDPNMDEVKQAFDVFDSNKDGFINATELQKVLCALGLDEGLEMESCSRMIGVFDQNGDGKIDFDEFVKIMNLC
ncbi:Probable calcium-binding protein CML45 [Striga hermonthica]|uniref:Probable calcium-binding protein CML45 n=1 Tax=Striga hermonthica TaxID=68872 RepID=A0A9N7MMX8_STRHE|nr:Probable calcium-binding protein CML45 [Striga hermonthica]